MTTQPSTKLRGACLQCRQAARAFSTTRSTRQFGPEHPRYIDIPVSPQQTGKSRQVPKGTLPVPRELFSGKRGLDDRRRESVRLATRDAEHGPGYEAPAEDSYLGWKARLSAQRKQNLREGVAELRKRHETTNRRREYRSQTRTQEREEAVSQPVREDERLTAHSNNFDYDALMRGEIDHSDRAKAIEESKERYALREQQKLGQRFDHLHTLFSKASTFITTPKQLDEAIEESFGTDESPVIFSKDFNNIEDAHSIWALGKPVRVTDLLKRANRISVSDGSLSPEQIRVRDQRLTKVAESLTGGTMG